MDFVLRAHPEFRNVARRNNYYVVPRSTPINSIVAQILVDNPKAK